MTLGQYFPRPRDWKKMTLGTKEMTLDQGGLEENDLGREENDLGLVRNDLGPRLFFPGGGWEK